MRYLRPTLSALFLSMAAACGPEGSTGPTVVPNLNGSWLVTVNLSVSLDGEWMCTVEQPTFNIIQTTDTFTGTSNGGQADCVSVAADSATISLDGARIFNGLIDPAGNLAFNFQTIDNLNQGQISQDRNSINGTLNWSFVLPPGIGIFFIGTWSGQRI